ncbi:MAG: polyprenol phosphomannose-dependent alpha 1,6 mannosyltransferase MptB [Frankiaceae bacterium]
MSRTPADSRLPGWSLAALVCSAAATATVGALGPSAAVPPLPGRRWGPLPPYSLFGPVIGSAPAELVSALLAISVLAGAAGLLGALRALSAGWRPDPRRLLAAGAFAVAVLAVVFPVGSADPKSYAAYGRMAATGADAYAATPQQRAAAGDPVAAAVESPWQNSPSVYGPLATAEQALIARVAGDSTRAAVGLLGLINGAAFLATGAVLQRLADTPQRRRRVAVLWSINPLLLLQLVAGAHLDTLVALAVVVAVALSFSRSRDCGAASRSVTQGTLAGAAAGAAAALKLPGIAVAAVLLWQSRRLSVRFLGILAGTAAVFGVGYAIVGFHALNPVRRASRFVSHASPWRPLAVLLDHFWGTGVSRTVLGLAAATFTVLLAGLFLRALPARGDPRAYSARGTLALTLAYLLATPYVLPWYAASAWALLALLPASGFDRVLLAHTTVLSLAYIPGRDVPLPPVLDRIAEATRNVCAPLLLLTVVVGAVVVARRGLASARAERSASRY